MTTELPRVEARPPVTRTARRVDARPPASTVPVRRRPLRITATFAVLAILLVTLMIVSAGTGQLSIPAGEVVSAIGRGWNSFVSGLGMSWMSVPEGVPITHVNGEATLWLVRFPRLVMAALVGAALGASGAVMQGSSATRSPSQG